MSIPYTSGDFTSARVNHESWIEYPFIEYGDNTTKVYHLVCEVNEADYSPIALDTTMANASNADVISLPFAADLNAYHVGDFGKVKIDGGLTRFDRQFANIPQASVDPSGSEIFTFPGLPSTAGAGSLININSASVASGVVTLNLVSAHGMANGDSFRYWLHTHYSTSSASFASVLIGGHANCLTGTTGSTIKTFIAMSSATTSITGYVYPFSARGRQQVSRKSSTQIEYNYFLPGVSDAISSSQDIALPQRFEPYYYLEGNSVESLSTSTTPTAVEYNNIVDNDGFLTLDSGISRWKGNILRRTVKSIRAI